MKFIDPKKVEREQLKDKQKKAQDDQFKKTLLGQREALLAKIKEKEIKRKAKHDELGSGDAKVDATDEITMGFLSNPSDNESGDKNSVSNEELTSEEIESRESETNPDKLEKRDFASLNLMQKNIMSKRAEQKRLQAEDAKKRSSSRDLQQGKIKELEDQIAKTKYNKSTQKGIGLMKAQLAALKTKMAGSSKTGKATGGYSVKKSGDATVVLLGFPSTGKSTLLNSLTNANSEVAAYAFTTLTVIPGMLNYKQAQIQILDVPGIVEGAAAGTGRGKEVLQVIRNADLILMVVDGLKPKQKSLLESEVYDSGVRINQRKPDIKIRKTIKDGIRVGRTVETEIDDETVKAVMNQFKIVNAEVLLRDSVDADTLIDAIEGNRVYIPAVVVVNKVDLLSSAQIEEVTNQIHPNLFISAQKKDHLEQLKELIYEKISFIRLYLKEINHKPDMEEPLIMRSGTTLRDVCNKLHRDFVEKFKFARIWGPSAKFDGQKILKLDHKLQDTDVIELHMK
jgi:small GTP-binding protein